MCGGGGGREGGREGGGRERNRAYTSSSESELIQSVHCNMYNNNIIIIFRG